MIRTTVTVHCDAPGCKATIPSYLAADAFEARAWARSNNWRTGGEHTGGDLCPAHRTPEPAAAPLGYRDRPPGRRWSDDEAKMSEEWGLLAKPGDTCPCGRPAVDVCSFSGQFVCGQPQCDLHVHSDHR